VVHSYTINFIKLYKNATASGALMQKLLKRNEPKCQTPVQSVAQTIASKHTLLAYIHTKRLMTT